MARSKNLLMLAALIAAALLVSTAFESVSRSGLKLEDVSRRPHSGGPVSLT